MTSKTPRMVRVTTNKFAGDWTFEQTKIIDHANSSDRKWLTSHLAWAVHNDRAITITPIRRESIAAKMAAQRYSESN